MSRGRPRPSRPKSMRRRPSSPSFPPACASCIRGNSRGGGSGSRPTSAAPPTSRSTFGRTGSTAGCLASCAGRRFATRTPAWDGNWTGDCFVAFAWHGAGDQPLLVVVNYAPNRSQCYLRPPFTGLAGRCWRLGDLTGDAVYDRDGDELGVRGLYLDMSPWQYHVFELTGT